MTPLHAFLAKTVHTTNSTITVRGAHYHIDHELFDIDKNGVGHKKTDLNALLYVVSDNIAMIVNDTSVIGVFKDTLTYLQKEPTAAPVRKRRDNPAQGAAGNIRTCSVVIWLSPQFIAKMGSLGVATAFAVYTVKAVSAIFESTKINSTYTYALSYSVSGTMVHPDGFTPDDVFNLVSDNFGTDACINALFTFIPNTPINGLATIEGACQPNRNWVLINTFDLPSAITVLAHEIGHSFGARHDTANCSSGLIMQPYLRTYATRFSECSLLDLQTNIPNIQCFISDVPSSPSQFGNIVFALSIVVSVFALLVSFRFNSKQR